MIQSGHNRGKFGGIIYSNVGTVWMGEVGGGSVNYSHSLREPMVERYHASVQLFYLYFYQNNFR